jgi:HSP90 family molecular chaperone
MLWDHDISTENPNSIPSCSYSRSVSVLLSCRLQSLKTRPEAVPDMEKGPDENGVVPTKTVMKKVLEWNVVNNKKPLWLRNPKECTESEYSDFYKQTFKAYDEPAAHAHFSVEGNVDFKALLFLPTDVPFELTRDMFAADARSMRLYVKRVFINDKFEDLVSWFCAC